MPMSAADVTATFVSDLEAEKNIPDRIDDVLFEGTKD